MEPLASQLRPRSLDEYVGQEHLVGAGDPSTSSGPTPSTGLTAGPLRVAIEQKHLFSFILWGPPGVGKTTLAQIYAHALDARLYALSAVSAGKDDIKKIIKDETGETPAVSLSNPPKILFLDEIHRFNKAQQDFLLPYVESGALTLIGATTENPSFEVIPALLSRCRVFVLEELSDADMEKIIARTGFKLSKKATQWLIAMSGGDARQAITMLENTHKLYGTINEQTLKDTLQSKTLRYDKAGEEHYNTISAFIKSMRASQPDAAMYYLARMVAAGEDPKFIARRMVVFASEDVGLAQPTALVVANEVFRACETIGYPECAINLAHGVAYLAHAKKDRSAYNALRAAQKDVEQYGNLAIPMKVRNAPTKLMKDLAYGEGYEMYPPHDEKHSYLPEKLKKRKYFK